MENFDLTTESRNKNTMNLDAMDSLALVTAMNREDAAVPRAVRKALPQVARAVDLAAAQLAKGGRILYVGTGTSGRIGALDASECPPTFGTDPKMVQYIIAGGDPALTRATEASEDSAELARRDILAKRVTKKDIVIGLAASGRTPYTIAALELARKKGAATVAIACNLHSEIAKAAEVAIEVKVGPEVLSGSSRLKAGTAQKLICNMITTGAMTQLGYVYSNLMVKLRMSNHKLRERGIRILQTLTDVDREQAIATIEKSGMNLPLAIVMLKANTSKTEATRRLRKTQGNVRLAIGE
jgi:N-acetylmuramic acid 6-phosphate etherase